MSESRRGYRVRLNQASDIASELSAFDIRALSYKGVL